MGISSFTLFKHFPLNVNDIAIRIIKIHELSSPKENPGIELPPCPQPPVLVYSEIPTPSYNFQGNIYSWESFFSWQISTPLGNIHSLNFLVNKKE